MPDSPRIGALFAGYGGLELGVTAALGGSVAWLSEIDAAANKVLAYHYPDIPNVGDITKVDWTAIEPVDVITGGSPCQDLSHAGKRGGMTQGTRSNLWVAMREAIAAIRPALVVWENVRGAFSATADSDVEHCPGCMGDGPAMPLRALTRVLGDFTDIGYDTRWLGLRAADVGAPHGRFRVFIVATAKSSRQRLERPAQREPCISAPWTSPAGSGANSIADSEHNGRNGAAQRRSISESERERRLQQPQGSCISEESTPADSDVGRREQPDARLRRLRFTSEDSRTPADSSSKRYGSWKDSGELGSMATDNERQAWQRQRARSLTSNRSAETNADSDVIHSSGSGHSGPGETESLQSPDRTVGRNATTADSSIDGLSRSGLEKSAGLSSTQWSEPDGRIMPTEWGVYSSAIDRWQRATGRLAPAPTESGKRGGQQLSPRFVEWMMGLPAGHVTAVPGISRADQLKCLGNGVVPQQAEAAVRYLLRPGEAA